MIIIAILFSLLMCSCSDLLTKNDPVPKDITFTPGTGTYYQDQLINLHCRTENSKIRYTTDGSWPTMQSDLYQTPIAITRSTTLRARAYTSNNSTEVFAIDIELKASAPTFYPLPGNYVGDQTITIASDTPGTTIRYTTNGSTPNQNSTLYTGPVSVSSTQTIRAIAMKTDWTTSVISQATYTIRAAAPTMSPEGNYYTSPQTVTMASSTPNSQIRYTTDGSIPTSSSTLYTGPILVSSTIIIKAKAYKTGVTESLLSTQSYGINTVSMPVFSPDPHETTLPAQITMSCSTPEAVIMYTLDGTEPTQSSSQYSMPITISSTTTLKAKAFKAGIAPSPTSSVVYSDLFEGFESGDFSTFPWILGGSRPWHITSGSGNVYSGNYAAKADNYDSASLTITHTTLGGYLTFYSKTGLSSYYGEWYLIIDGSYHWLEQHTNWNSHQYYLSPGTHTIEWLYWGYYSNSFVILDSITFPQ